MTRSALLAQLENEAAIGWPAPWWPQDLARTYGWDTPRFCPEALQRYIDLIADALTERRARERTAA